MSEREVTLFFNFKEILFYDIFDTSKTERAKTFPSFSDKPHAMQADMGGHGVAISCSFFSTWPLVQARGWEKLSLKCLFKLLTMLVSVSCNMPFKQLIICTDECTVLYSLAQVHFSNQMMYLLYSQIMRSG